MSTRYARETGAAYPRVVPHDARDVLSYLPNARRAPRFSAAWSLEYRPLRERAFKPVLLDLIIAEETIDFDRQFAKSLPAFDMQAFGLAVMDGDEAGIEKALGVAA